MDLWSGTGLEIVLKFLSEQAQTSLGEKLIVVAVVWYVMGRKVSQHFDTIERRLDSIGENLSKLKNALVDLERSQGSKIDTLTSRVDKLEKRFDERKDPAGS